MVDYGVIAIVTTAIVFYSTKFYFESSDAAEMRAIETDYYPPPARTRSKPRSLRRKRKQVNDVPPSWTVCNDISPDGILGCRLEVGHVGWHSHHGPVSWYHGEWAEDDFNFNGFRGNIPW
jgi:hypothetical protein